MASSDLSMCLALLLLAALSSGLTTDRASPAFVPSEVKLGFTVKNFTFQNYVDHFTSAIRQTFSQRYYLVDDYWDKKGPAIIYLCGENVCNFPYNRQFPVRASEQLHALYIVIEHRFYGQSQPTANWSLDNLRYLTHEQALADVAYFIERTNADLQAKYQVRPKWIVVGGSYAGALSAWFRFKYPHLVVGSLASSGVVVPKAEFWELERQIVDDLAEDGDGRCYNILKYYHTVVEQRVFNSSKEDRLRFIRLFDAEYADTTSDDEFMFYFADMAILFPQYSQRASFCKMLKKLNESGQSVDSQLHELAEAGKKFGSDMADYTYRRIRNETIDHTAARQWTYQYCTAYGWLQTPSPVRPLRWKGMTMEYWMRYCKNAISKDLVMPKVNHTAAMFGADLIAKAGSNIFFTQSRNDPWRWMGIHELVPGNPRIEVGLQDCADCGHCRELETPRDDDPEAVKEVRKRILAAMRKWIA